MILTGPEIKRQRSLGRITIDPFNAGQINPNSYNYRLGSEILELQDRGFDPKKRGRFKRYCIKEDGIVLRPGKNYLAHTLETMGSDYYVTSLIGRSTIGRMGLWLQVTADLGHVGTKHKWTLEMKVVQPLRVYAGMEIGQVSFWKVLGKPLFYSGKYACDICATPSRIQEEFYFS